MRGELFEENEINCEDRKLNPLLSSDIYELQQHYEVLLEYVEELEKRVNKYREERDKYKRLWKASKL